MLLPESQVSLHSVLRSPLTRHPPAVNFDVELWWRLRGLRGLGLPGAAVYLQLVARHGHVVARPEAQLGPEALVTGG